MPKPTLPRNATSRNVHTKSKHASRSAWKGLKAEDLKDLGQKIKEHFQWDHTPRAFQLEAIEAQLLRKDVLVHAGTGSGKTFIAAGPHAHEATKGMVTFMVTPLIALQEEQVKTFQEEYKLTSVAVNSNHGGCTKEIMADICQGKWQIVVISPEMMLSKRFVANVLRNNEMRNRVLSVVIDEAHVVSHWGSGFRKTYGTLGILRALLPKDTPMVAMSATLSDRVQNDVLKKLQFDLKNYTYLNLGNDRPNVSLVVRAIQNPIGSYSDLDFLIPEGVTAVDDVKKTFVYADNIAVGSEIMEHLYDIAPDDFREAGIIRTYSAAFSSKYRREVMELFKSGHIRILICTDAAGMGCNLPDIDIVVQWKLPGSVSSFVQRAGRAARDPGRTGLAVLLVEKSAYDADLDEHQKQQNDDDKKRKGHVRETTKYPKSKDKNYAENHGALRGSFGGAFDERPSPLNVPLDRSSIDEGLHTLAQTTDCRRGVIAAIFGNKGLNPTVPCCDLCCPELLDLTRPAPPARKTRKKGTAPGKVDENLREEIIKWRTKIWKRDFEDAPFGPSAILTDSAIDALASFGNIGTQAGLENALGYWGWIGKYGNELLELFRELDVAPKQAKDPKPRAPRGTKRSAQTEEEGRDSSGSKAAPQAKRVRRSTVPEAAALPAHVTPSTGPSSVQATVPETPLRPPPGPATLIPQTAIPSSLAYNPYASLLTPTPYYTFAYSPAPYSTPNGTFYAAAPSPFGQPSNMLSQPYVYPPPRDPPPNI